MTDRELLEAAAKAIGVSLVWGDVYGVGGAVVDCTDIPYIRSDQPDKGDVYWNPLTDDGDALRLAVKLNLFTGAEFYHYRALERFAHQDQDELFATRRAIVRAAAAIGAQQ